LYKIQPKTVFVGKTIKYLPTCHSTNDYCQEILLNESYSEGLVVYTDYQTGGRGQRGNTWQAEPGQNLMLSLILKPDFLKAYDQFYLNMVISLAIFNTLNDYIPDKLRVKWPNDIYFEHQKLGGILIENSIQGNYLTSSIVGIGLNVNQIEFKNLNANSLRNVIEKVVDLSILYSSVLEKIEKYYLFLKNQEYDLLKNEYLKILFRLNEWHQFKKNNLKFIGKITGVDSNGRLEIETEIGLEVFDFKEVEFVI
jgi:BirA family biotin operon repressor/biotin-[acetyl-CoA-carboxylase] ligase